jgi:hypothetical protein
MIERFMVAPWTACSARLEDVAAESSTSDPSRYLAALRRKIARL